MLTLSTAYGCVLLAALLPYVWVVIAKTSGERFSNRDPRGWVARQQDNPRVQRAYAAHLNGFEAFGTFAAGVALAQLAGVPADRIAALSLAFVVFRIAHGLLYIGNRPTLRSAVWAGGFGCAMALLVMAIAQVA